MCISNPDESKGTAILIPVTVSTIIQCIGLWGMEVVFTRRFGADFVWCDVLAVLFCRCKVVCRCWGDIWVSDYLAVIIETHYSSTQP